jgi:hypothetical protein
VLGSCRPGLQSARVGETATNLSRGACGKTVGKGGVLDVGPPHLQTLFDRGITALRSPILEFPKMPIPLYYVHTT